MNEQPSNSSEHIVHPEGQSEKEKILQFFQEFDVEAFVSMVSSLKDDTGTLEWFPSWEEESPGSPPVLRLNWRNPKSGHVGEEIFPWYAIIKVTREGKLFRGYHPNDVLGTDERGTSKKETEAALAPILKERFAPEKSTRTSWINPSHHRDFRP